MVVTRQEARKIAALTAVSVPDVGAPAQQMPPPDLPMPSGRGAAIGVRTSQPEDRELL